MSEPSSDPDVTLAFFLEVMAARVNRLQTSETRPFKVRGIPIRPTNPRPYGDGQVYSGSLKDPRTRAVIEARYPASLLDAIEWGAEAVVVGTVVYRLDPQGVIRPLLKVDSVERTGGAKLVSKAELMERWQAAIARAKRDPAAALSADKPVVAVVTGGSSVALDDILAQLGGLTEDVDLRRLDVPITAPEAVAGSMVTAALYVVRFTYQRVVRRLDSRDDWWARQCAVWAALACATVGLVGLLQSPAGESR